MRNKVLPGAGSAMRCASGFPDFCAPFGQKQPNNNKDEVRARSRIWREIQDDDARRGGFPTRGKPQLV